MRALDTCRRGRLFYYEADYGRAQRMRTKIAQDFHEAFVIGFDGSSVLSRGGMPSTPSQRGAPGLAGP